MKSNRSCSLAIEAARRRLQVWRTSRARGKRIPDRLWALAAALARPHGVSPVAQRLGLAYHGLKRRAEATPLPRRARRRPPPGFVELSLVAQPVLGPHCTLALARGEGTRLTTAEIPQGCRFLALRKLTGVTRFIASVERLAKLKCRTPVKRSGCGIHTFGQVRRATTDACVSPSTGRGRGPGRR